MKRFSSVIEPFMQGIILIEQPTELKRLLDLGKQVLPW